MKKATTSKGNEQVTGWDNFKGFVNYSLSDSDKKSAGEWVAKADLIAIVERVVFAGYKMSVGLDQKSDRFLASLSTKAGDNAGWVLTARGGEFWVAVGRLMYLHTEVFGSAAWGDREVYSDDQW